MLERGKAFPAFALPDEKGTQRTNGNFAGQWLVLYFYPKDNTGG